MKKAYILLSVIILTTFIALWISLNLNISAYTPRAFLDTYDYLQAKIYTHDAKELAKYFLYKAKEENKECLEYAQIEHEKAVLRVDYLYPIAECENFKLKNINPDANLSKDGIIILNISVAINSNTHVNEEIFINKKSFLQTRESFWKTKP